MDELSSLDVLVPIRSSDLRDDAFTSILVADLARVEFRVRAIVLSLQSFVLVEVVRILLMLQISTQVVLIDSGYSLSMRST